MKHVDNPQHGCKSKASPDLTSALVSLQLDYSTLVLDSLDIIIDIYLLLIDMAGMLNNPQQAVDPRHYSTKVPTTRIEQHLIDRYIDR